MLRSLLLVGMIATLVGPVAPARASFHVMQITEVFTGVAGAPNAQYVELTTLIGGQHEVEDKRVVLYNASGTAVQTATFANDVPDASTGQSKILVATSDAQTFFGVTADQLIGAAAGIATGGKACFMNDVGNPTDYVDCVSWGNFTGAAPSDSDGATGNPVSPTEGILAGAAIERKIGRGSATTYDGPDDTNNSRLDFRLRSPRPQGGGTPTVDLQRIGFGQTTYTVDEPDDKLIDVERAGPTDGIKAFNLSTANMSATAPSDYNAVDLQDQFSAGEVERTHLITVHDDPDFEGVEAVRLKVRGPQAGAVLDDNMTATLRIKDVDDDAARPKSRITRPSHLSSYKRGKFKALRGTASDGIGNVTGVDVAVRRKMKSGACKWLSGTGWINGACTAKLFMDANGAEQWNKPLPFLLPKSVGTKTKFYTAYSRATDENLNVEINFKIGRNANRFEIK